MMLSRLTWLAVGVGATAFALTVLTGELLDDHFGRITLGYQWGTLHQIPFRDYFDPGLFGAAAWSAVALALSGGSLFGEVIFDSLAIGLGLALTCSLAARAARSAFAGVLAAVTAFASGVRLYDYDKVLSYPAGLWACWYYADRPSPRRAAVATVIIAGATLLRYDTGLYLGASWAVTLLATHRSAVRPLVRDMLVSLGVASCIAAPVLLWLLSIGAWPDAMDQIVSYARIESRRTQILDWTALSKDGVQALWINIMRRGIAAGSVYLTIALLVPVAIAAAWMRKWGLIAGSDAPATPHILAGATMSGLLVVFVLRDPLPARFGGVLPVACVLGACVAGFATRGLARRAVAIAACALAIMVTQAGELTERFDASRLGRGPRAYVAQTQSYLAMLRVMPPALGLMPGGDRSRNLAWYLRQCTGSADTIMVTWFAPQVYYFAQRPFAGGIWAFFGDHWTSEARQREVIDRLRQRPPSIVVIDRDRPEFAHSYAMIAAFIDQAYRVGGTTDFDLRQAPRFQILVPENSQWASRDPVWRLPCRPVKD